MYTLLNETARKIQAITPSSKDENVSVIHFDQGKSESFLSWFMESKKPVVGSYLVKDSEGFTRCVATLEA